MGTGYCSSMRSRSEKPITSLSESDLNIGIDGGQLANTNTGIGRYTLELCRALDSLLPNAHFFIYSKYPVTAPVKSSRWVVRIEPTLAARRLHEWFWTTFRCSALCARDDLDVFWGARSLVPSLSSGIKCIVTIYDLFHLNRQLVSLKRWLFYRWFIGRSLRRANVIVTISKDTALELRRLQGYASDAVIRPAVSHDFRPRSEPEIASVLRHYALSRPYLLNTSRWDPKKNLAVLLHAFLDMKKNGLIPDYALALVGSADGNDKGNAQLRGLVHDNRTAGLALLGNVPEDHLPALYSGCDAFVFPSSHEGFGIPVLEARACGARVIAANIPALREAGETEAMFVNPTTQGIREGILTTLNLPTPRIERQRLWTWQDSAELLARTFIPAE